MNQETPQSPIEQSPVQKTRNELDIFLNEPTESEAKEFTNILDMYGSAEVGIEEKTVDQIMKELIDSEQEDLDRRTLEYLDRLDIIEKKPGISGALVKGFEAKEGIINNLRNGDTEQAERILQSIISKNIRYIDRLQRGEQVHAFKEDAIKRCRANAVQALHELRVLKAAKMQ